MTKKIALSLLATGFLAGSLVWAGEGKHSRRKPSGGTEQCGRMEEHRGERRSKQRMKKHGMQEMQKLFQEDIRTNQAAVLAKLSGKPAEELQSQLETRSLGALMEEHGLSLEQVQPLLHARMITMVYEAVEAKRITQREANRMYASMGVAAKACKGGEHSRENPKSSDS